MFILGNTARILINEEVKPDTHISIVDFIEMVNQISEITDIEVVINTEGGSVLAGYSIYTALVRSSKRVTTIIDGLAASIGSIIFFAGEVRKAYEHSVLMVHNASGGSDKVLDKINKSLFTILDKESITKGEMEAETWLLSDQMLKREMIDELIVIEDGKEVERQNNFKALFEVCNKLNSEKYNNMEDKNEEIVDEAVVETAEVTTEEVVVEEVVNEVVNEEIVESTEENKEETPSTEKEEEVEAPVAEEEAVITNEEKVEVEAKVEVEGVENLVAIKALNSELVNKNKELTDKVGELENKLAELDAEKVKSEKEDYLKEKNIEITNTWLNLDLDVIKDLTKTITKKAPSIENKVSDVNMSVEDKKNLLRNDPAEYTRLIRTGVIK
jgi:ATP-dependent protease ClpP protease subunit